MDGSWANCSVTDKTRSSGQKWNSREIALSVIREIRRVSNQSQAIRIFHCGPECVQIFPPKLLEERLLEIRQGHVDKVLISWSEFKLSFEQIIRKTVVQDEARVFLETKGSLEINVRRLRKQEFLSAISQDFYGPVQILACEMLRILKFKQVCECINKF